MLQKLKNHIAFKQAATLLIASSLLCVLFGKGVHLHSVLDHVFDHGHIHTVVHAHPADEATTESAFHGDEQHQHQVASIDLNGIFTKSSKHKVAVNQILVASVPMPDFVSLWINRQPPILFDLPPPERISSQYHSYSFFLRGPPVA